MKTEAEIRLIISDMEDPETQLDDHMKGYLAALRWVLEEGHIWDTPVKEQT